MSNGQIQGITDQCPASGFPPAGRMHFREGGQAKGTSSDAGQYDRQRNDPDRARRFREAALPYLDDVYTLARYLLRDASDAEDAVQECYLRALKHFDSYRGPAMKPWLFAILRNVCRAEYARRASAPTTVARRHAGDRRADADVARGAADAGSRDDAASATPPRSGGSIDTLAEPFKETFVLREINNLSYREIADAVGAPVGTVMSRLARARAMLRSAWLAEQEQAK